MNMEKFYEKIGAIFEELHLLTTEFRYNPKTLEYYSVETVVLDDGFDYTIIVKEDGRVLYGEVDGNDFYEEGVLGYIYV